jgi:iron complex transport system substrate-binding protein
MFYIKLLNLVVLSCVIILFSCGTNNKTKLEVSTHSKNNYSKYLKIKETNEGVLLDILHPDRKNRSYKYFVTESKSSKTPKGYLRIERENMSFLVLSATHIGMLEKLNQVSKIKGTCAKEYIYSNTIKQKIDIGEIEEFGNEGTTSFEKIIKLKPKIIVYSGFSSEFSKASEFEKMNIIPIPNFDWKETHPLGKAEWILFFGYLTGTEVQAKAHFNKLKDDYLNLCKKVNEAKSTPSVMMGSKIGDYWYGPAGNSYGAKLLLDAKANYIYKNTKGTASIEYSLEKVFSDAKNVEFWINPGFSSYKLLELNNSKAKYFSSFQNKKVFCYTHNPNKFWELSGVHPDWILSDIIQILHPEIKLNQPIYFYKAIE